MSSPSIRAASDADIPAVRLLFSEYQHSVSAPECFVTFEQELASLPGAYAPLTGVILIAGEERGCVAVRPLSPEVAEIKRLYVRPSARTEGLGRRLMEAGIAFARQAGYAAVRLDTLATMTAAIRLYQSLGFEAIDRYNDTPGVDTRFFELRLR